jgi:tetratricopeptide (TPR) repeat protein
MMRRTVAAFSALVLLGGMWGCGPAPVAPTKSVALFPVEPSPPESSDQAKLKEGLTRREMSPSEVADLSDRLLADGGNTFDDQETMARLELLLLKAMQSPDKTRRSTLWRNLGIIHYHQKKYKTAEHDFQSANELDPKNARTHYYLACLFTHKGRIYASKGKKRIARQQFKRAAIEMELARKLAPQNALYKQDPQQIIRQENGQ